MLEAVVFWIVVLALAAPNLIVLLTAPAKEANREPVTRTAPRAHAAG
jgi:hypothetical protein